MDFQFNGYLVKLQKAETTAENLADYFALFDGLARELEAKRDNKYTKLLECVARIVERELANPSLSLDAIAEEVNLSPLNSASCTRSIARSRSRITSTSNAWAARAG